MKAPSGAFLVRVFENSSLGRVVQQGAPGTVWQPTADRNLVDSSSLTGRTVVSDYGTNDPNDVRFWIINNDGAISQFYPSGSLSKITTKDENWIKTNGKVGTTEEYRDFEGRLVLKRKWETAISASNTYFVYDDFGDLRYIIPPGFTATTLLEAGTGDFHEFIYAYRYDNRRRLIERKVPGKGWDHLVYNKNNQLVQQQDAELRKSNKWIVTKYDVFGRPVITGIHQGSNPRQTEQDYMNQQTILWEQRLPGQLIYSNASYPQNNFTTLTVNYYDDYTFENAGLLPAKGIVKSANTQSLVTGVLVYKEDGTMPLLTVNYYDDNGRLIQTAAQNHLKGTDYVTNTYNFEGTVVKSTKTHTSVTGEVLTIVTTFEYDHMNRLVQTKKKVNSQAEIIQSKISYNEIGQMKGKGLHSENGTTFMTNIDYEYNERGWAKRVNSPHFTESLAYNDASANKLYNGNIAEKKWRYGNEVVKTTYFTYDALNRLKTGKSEGILMNEEVMYDNMGAIGYQVIIMALTRGLGSLGTIPSSTPQPAY